MQISPTYLESRLFAFFNTSYKTTESIASGAVFLCGPLLALVIAVLAKDTITTSSSLLAPTCPELYVEFDLK